jgi:hypothetical protein
MYDAGLRARCDAREHWGQLDIERSGTTLIATLRALNGNRSVHILPQLYDVHLVRMLGDVFELRGFQKSVGWHLQVWSCRYVTTHEVALASRSHGDPVDPDYPRFLRWWAEVAEYAHNRPNRAAAIDVQDIVRLLDLGAEEVIRFVEWLCESRRAYSTSSGSSRGSVCLKPGPYEDAEAPTS